MLELIDIVKVYGMGENAVHALKGVSLKFRKNEFVSVLGPSGCGKTTMLNIVGGLDRYSCGDLLIRGKSTKHFKAYDWDAYRNNCVGFVFQNYNLIPHQTVLGNVELALTLSGVSSSERKRRASEALDKVGLSDQKHKKPNQLSGGQMQRVAIARAIVNDPEIILADEPTGALDSATSIQVINLLKEIAKDRLVIMVTHNNELAAAYSTRIINLLDGFVVGDTNPLTGEETAVLNAQMQAETENNSTKNKRQNNQNDNVSVQANQSQNSVKTDDLQQKTDNLPQNQQGQQVQQSTQNADNLPQNQQVQQSQKQPKQKKMKTSMSFFTALNLSLRNLLTKKGRSILVSFAGSIGIIGIALVLAISNGFKVYIKKIETETLANFPISITRIGLDIDSLTQSYTPDERVTEFPDGSGIGFYEQRDIMDIIGKPNDITKEFVEYIDGLKQKTSTHSEYRGQTLALDVQKSYAVTMPLLTNYEKGDVVKFVNQRSSSGGGFSFGASSSSGAFSEMLDNPEFLAKQYDMIAGAYPSNFNEIALIVDTTNRIDKNLARNLGFNETLEEIDFDKIVNQKEYKIILNDLYYSVDQSTGEITALEGASTSELENIFQKTDDEGVITLKISGIMRERKDAVMAMYGTGLVYLPSLTQKYLASCSASPIATLQTAALDKTQVSEMQVYKALFTEFELKEAFYEVISFYEEIIKGLQQIPGAVLNEQTLKMMLMQDDTFASMDEQTINEFCQMFLNLGDAIDQLKDENQNSFGFAAFYFKEFFANGFVSIEDVKSSVMQTIGVGGLPTSIYIYPRSFETKGEIMKYIKDWNNNNPDNYITATDPASMLSATMGQMIDIISYVLAAFAGVSLVVSSIMIGIITYVSVIERTKEIGVLRSIGARRKDIATVFNAETIIIGFIAGLMGVIIAYLLCIPINLIITALAGSAIMGNLAILNPLHALILIAISTLLTLLSGLMPAIYASRKDPVIALRSE